MTKLKVFFAYIRWWEWLYLSVYFAAVLTIGIFFKSGPIIMLNVIFAVISNFFVAKGMAIGNVFGIVNLFIYCTNCFQNRFFGEIICSAIITLPAYCLSLYTWIKSQKKGSQVLSVNKRLKNLEWIFIFVVVGLLSFGIYFLLKSFDTANLIVSTLSTILGLLAGYLIIRRCELNFLFYIFTNIACIVLWLSSVSDESLANLPIVCVYFMFLFLNSFGLYNWVRLKKLQNNENDNFAKMLKICKSNLQ